MTDPTPEALAAAKRIVLAFEQDRERAARIIDEAMEPLRRENLELRGMQNTLADLLARYTGRTVPDEIAKATRIVQSKLEPAHDWCAKATCQICNNRFAALQPREVTNDG